MSENSVCLSLFYNGLNAGKITKIGNFELYISTNIRCLPYYTSRLSSNCASNFKRLFFVVFKLKKLMKYGPYRRTVAHSMCEIACRGFFSFFDATRNENCSNIYPRLLESYRSGLSEN